MVIASPILSCTSQANEWYVAGSYEAYIRAVLVPACTPVEEGGLGYRAVIVNFRGCKSRNMFSDPLLMSNTGAGVPITSPQLYSAGTTDDLRQALLYIATLHPTAPLLGLGFSLGANILTRYLAEEGNESRLNSGCGLASVSYFLLPSWDFFSLRDFAKAVGFSSQQPRSPRQLCR